MNGINDCEGSDLSFSWYCRRPVTFTVADTDARTGEAMFGRAAVARILPVCAGTAAATLLNIAKEYMWEFSVFANVD